ncbi:MAG: hypothetical protein K2X38_20455 [Gemmataceae bacterium]|nr:hypothetical protein [Gemmataceae bacterium]
MSSPNVSTSPSSASTSSKTAAQFERDFGQTLLEAVNVSNWSVGPDLAGEYQRMQSEVSDAVRRENAVQKQIRERVFPELETRKTRPKFGGRHAASLDDLQRVHRGLLFNGGVEACDGTLKTHSTVPLTIHQIGVSMVTYQGASGSWKQRLFRRDLRQRIEDPVSEALSLLEGRARQGLDQEGSGALIQQTLLQYAERAILMDRSNAVWRLGHGNPVTYELLTGGGTLEMMEASLNLLRRMVEKVQKFVYIASSPREQLLLTIGAALRPYEYAIVQTLNERLDDWLHQRRFDVEAGASLHWDGETLPSTEWIPRFIKKVASRIVVGVFRASEAAPPLVFYAHDDHAQAAAHIAIADGMLTGPRGFPLLLEIARHVGREVFGQGIEELAQSAFAAAGEPWRYQYA